MLTIYLRALLIPCQVRFLFDTGGSIVAREILSTDLYPRPPLAISVRNGDYETITFAVLECSKYGFADAVDSDVQHLLCQVAARGDVPGMQSLYDAWFRAMERRSSGSRRCKRDVLRISRNTAGNDWSDRGIQNPPLPIWYACAGGHVEAVKWCFDNGAADTIDLPLKEYEPRYRMEEHPRFMSPEREWLARTSAIHVAFRSDENLQLLRWLYEIFPEMVCCIAKDVMVLIQASSAGCIGVCRFILDEVHASLRKEACERWEMSGEDHRWPGGGSCEDEAIFEGGLCFSEGQRGLSRAMLHACCKGHLENAKLLFRHGGALVETCDPDSDSQNSGEQDDQDGFHSEDDEESDDDLTNTSGENRSRLGNRFLAFRWGGRYD